MPKSHDQPLYAYLMRYDAHIESHPRSSPKWYMCQKNWNLMKRIQVIIRAPTADGRTDGQTDGRTNRVNGITTSDGQRPPNVTSDGQRPPKVKCWYTHGTNDQRPLDINNAPYNDRQVLPNTSFFCRDEILVPGSLKVMGWCRSQPSPHTMIAIGRLVLHLRKSYCLCFWGNIFECCAHWATGESISKINYLNQQYIEIPSHVLT